MKKIILFFITFILITGCTKKQQNIDDIKYFYWNNVKVDEKAIKIAENELAGYKTAIFKSELNFDIIKKFYLLNKYAEDVGETNLLINQNISIKLIKIDEKYTNILIRLKP